MYYQAIQCLLIIILSNNSFHNILINFDLCFLIINVVCNINIVLIALTLTKDTQFILLKKIILS